MAFADDRPDSLSLLEQEEMRESVIAAIAALPERLQLVVQLYFVEELNLSEIAQVLFRQHSARPPVEGAGTDAVARGTKGVAELV